MGTVTSRDLANVQAALGGSNPISLNEYYRGGAYVPTTRTVSGREPTSGEYYTFSNPVYFVAYFSAGAGRSEWAWSGAYVYNAGGNPSTVVSGIYTYYKGSFRGQFNTKAGPELDYGIYRTYSSTTSINTGVPSSGTISLNQLLGAQNP
jgi:hypothetical protein